MSMESEEQPDDEYGGGAQHYHPETYEYVTVLEYNETAEEYEKEPGERFVVSGHRRNQHIRDEEKEGFVRVADGIAPIELYEPLTNDEITEWCNSGAGKLALSHYFDNVDAVEEEAL